MNYRIVSLVPSLTAFMVAIGLSDHLVGISDFCAAPPGNEPPRIGGSRNPDLSAIAALAPDHILATRQECSAAELQALAPNCMISLLDIRCVADVAPQLTTLAAQFGAADRASQLGNQIAAAQATAVAAMAGRPPRRVLAFSSREPWIAIGGESYAADLLGVCGGLNIAERLGPRMPRAGLDVFMQYNPQVILLAGRPDPFSITDQARFRRFGDVAAVLARRIHICDGTLLFEYGFRTAEAIRNISSLIWRT
ncbi:MAG TPA: helical backbone metal receptor [Roseiflexaceae bacterium]|nr:helical backbone metal receptor [Roseiflexaceae bacterium]